MRLSTPREALALLRSLRGTPGYAPALALLRAWRRERQARDHVERLREDQSRRLYAAARDRDAAAAEGYAACMVPLHGEHHD